MVSHFLIKIPEKIMDFYQFNKTLTTKLRFVACENKILAIKFDEF